MPIDPTDPQFEPMLQKLQGNILKSHGRNYATHIYFRFTGTQAASHKLVGSLSELGTSAAEQQAQTTAHKANGTEALFGAHAVRQGAEASRVSAAASLR